MARTRDFFPAYVVAVALNKLRREDSDHLWSAEDILEHRYPKESEERVIITHDPDFGAAGDWRILKQSLKGTRDG